MADQENDNMPTLSDTHSKSVDENVDSRFRQFVSSTQSASISIPVNSTESYGSETSLVGFTGPLRSERKEPLVQMSGPLYINRNTENLLLANHGVTARKKTVWDDKATATNAHLWRSGQLGMCNDPYRTTCPPYCRPRASQQLHSKTSSKFDSKFQSVLYGDAKGWARRFSNAISPYIPGVMNPYAKVLLTWSKFFAISCLVAIFVDPLFFILPSVQHENKCLVIGWPMTKAVVVFRCLTDAIYLLNMLLQFRLAYAAPESRAVGAGELVEDPKKIAKHYLRGWFLIDLFVVLPLPQLIVLLVLPNVLGSSGANYAKNLLLAAILVQYIPRLLRFIPLLTSQSPTGIVFETVSANVFINLLAFVLAGHIIGCCWYLFGLLRINECLREACSISGYQHECMKFIDCGYGDAVKEYESHPNWNTWIINNNATACFTQNSFSYGIYAQAVDLTGQNTITRYIYSLFWGFLQISTLAGNLVPSYFVWEVLFAMLIIGLGLLLFAFLIGNIQSFLQSLGRRRLQMSLRQHDLEQWMRHRRLPEELRRRVREAERYHQAATRDVDEEMLLENFPEDLQRDIRRHFFPCMHLFEFVKKVWIFRLMDDHTLDAVCEKLEKKMYMRKKKIYMRGTEIFSVGGLIEKMVFIVRGKLESIGQDGTVAALSEGDVCGEELLTWFLEHGSVSGDGRKLRIAGQRLISSRTVRCLTNVEAFSLSASDLEEVTSLFPIDLRNPLVQAAIRYQSPYWREPLLLPEFKLPGDIGRSV